MTEFKDALEYADREIAATEENLYHAKKSNTQSMVDLFSNKLAYFKKIRRALRIADRLMQEPSEEMVRVSGNETVFLRDNPRIFKAMRNQMLREIEDDITG